jgi:MATE family multidrug resistance protein
VRQVALLAYPVILTQLSHTLMGVVDSAMVGQLGATQLAAVGFAGAWLWTLFYGFIGASTGVQTFVSQACGAGRKDECGYWAWQGIYALIPPAALAVLLFYFAVDSLLRWLAPSEAVQQLAGNYMAIGAFGAVGLSAATIFTAFFLGIGDSRTPLYATLFANGLNIVLDYGLIFGKLGLPAWGVSGAAVATMISQWVFALIILVIFCRSSMRRTFATQIATPSLPAIRRVWRLGIPVGGQYAIEMLSFAAFLTLVARLGDASLAASQAFIALLSMSFMQAEGLGIAASTLVGRYIGAGQPDHAARSFRSAQKLTLLISGSVALIFLAIPETLLGIFSDDPEVLMLGAPLLLIGAAYQFFDAFGIVADGALRGAGDTLRPFLVRLGLAWGLFLPLAWILMVRLDGGLTLAWVAGAVYVTVLAGYLVRRFRSEAWRKIRI